MNVKLRLDIIQKQKRNIEIEKGALLNTETIIEQPITKRAPVARQPVKPKQEHTLLRKKMIKDVKAQLVELDKHIKTNSEATGLIDPDKADLRNVLMRSLRKLRKPSFLNSKY